MMKKLAFILTLIPFLAGAFPVHTNRFDFDPSQSTGQFDDYLWRWSGFDDQSVELLFKDVTVSNVGFRLAYPQRGRVFLDILPPATTNSFIVITNEVLDVYTNFYPAIFNRVTDRGFTNITETLNYSNGVFLSRSVVTNSSKAGSVQNTTQVLPPATVVITQSSTVTNTEPYGLFTNSFVQSQNITITVSNFLENVLAGTFKQGNNTFYFFDPIRLSGFGGITLGGGTTTNGFTATRQATLVTNFLFAAGDTYLISDETYLQQGQFTYELWTAIGSDTNKQIIYSASSSLPLAQNISTKTNLFTSPLSGTASVYRTAISTANSNSVILYSSGIVIYKANATNLAQSVYTNTVTLSATTVTEFAFPSTQRVSKIYSKTETPYSRTTFSIPRLSIPPDGPYFSEVLTYSGSSPTNPSQSRTLAKGQVTVENSIWGVTNYAGFTNYPGPWQYLLQDGSRAMAGNLNMGGFGVTNASVFSFSSGPSITASNVNLWNSFIVGTNVGLVTGTEFGGDVTGTYDTLTLKKDALVGMDFVGFNSNFTTQAEGRLVATENGGLQFGLRGGNVNVDIGHETLVYVRNGETNGLVDGDVVFFSGNIGDVPLVKRASATNEIQCRNLAGIVTESIPVNGFGRVTWYGQVRDLTINPHTVYTNSTILYLSTVPGQFTNVPPKAPDHRVVLGRVERNQSSGGGDIIHVQIDIGEHLEYLHDVNVNSRTTNDLLIYNGTIWTNYARTNLNSIYLPLAGGTMSGDINMLDGNITNIQTLNSSTGYEIDFQAGIFDGGTWGFVSQPTIPGYLTVTGAAATYVNSTNLPAGIVTTNNLSTIAGSGLGVTSNRLVVTNVASPSNWSAFAATQFVTNNYGFVLSGSTIDGSASDVLDIFAGDTVNVKGGAALELQSDGLIKLTSPSIEIPSYMRTNGNASTLTNFPTSLLTVSAGNINYWRITTAPTGSTSSGSSGQMAVSGTNLFIYSPNALGVGTARWIRVSGDVSW